MQPVCNGYTVYSQIMGFLPIKEFRQCIERYIGNYRIRSFICFDQCSCMAFAQLTYLDSLPDIEVLPEQHYFDQSSLLEI